jgi:uncharacterized protein with von Willebrand factor type A (vWA) domain
MDRFERIARSVAAIEEKDYDRMGDYLDKLLSHTEKVGGDLEVAIEMCQRFGIEKARKELADMRRTVGELESQLDDLRVSMAENGRGLENREGSSRTAGVIAPEDCKMMMDVIRAVYDLVFKAKTMMKNATEDF